MSIHMVLGKPGGGKGLTAMQMIVDELTQGQRPIVTNLAVEVHPWIDGKGKAYPGLKYHLCKKYGGDFDVEKRIWRITDEQAAEFYLYRVIGGERVTLDHKREKGGVVEYDTTRAMGGGGCMYVIDECWKFWGARAWQSTGAGLLFAAAQHRKFGDDWVLVTQFLKQLDSQLRSLPQDFAVVRNHGKERLGIFRQPGIFSRAVYQEPPTGTATASERQVFRLDAEGLAGSYDTTAGVGISGRGVGDKGERRKGLSMGWMIAAVVLLAAAATQVPRLLGWAVGSTIHGSVEAGMAAAGVTNKAGESSAVGVSGGTNGVNLSDSQVLTPKAPKAPGAEKSDVWLVGLYSWSRAGEVVERVALMSDGRKWSSRDPEVRGIGPDWVCIRDRIYRYDPARRREPERRERWNDAAPMRDAGNSVVVLNGAGRRGPVSIIAGGGQ